MNMGKDLLIRAFSNSLDTILKVVNLSEDYVSNKTGITRETISDVIARKIVLTAEQYIVISKTVDSAVYDKASSDIINAVIDRELERIKHNKKTSLESRYMKEDLPERYKSFWYRIPLLTMSFLAHENCENVLKNMIVYLKRYNKFLYIDKNVYDTINKIASDYDYILNHAGSSSYIYSRNAAIISLNNLKLLKDAKALKILNSNSPFVSPQHLYQRWITKYEENGYALFSNDSNASKFCDFMNSGSSDNIKKIICVSINSTGIYLNDKEIKKPNYSLNIDITSPYKDSYREKALGRKISGMTTKMPDKPKSLVDKECIGPDYELCLTNDRINALYNQFVSNKSLWPINNRK